VIKKILPLLLATFLTSCGGASTRTPFQLYQGPTAVLPTALPTKLPTPTGTLVMGNPWTPTPIPTKTPLPDEAFGFVVEILDGETVFVVLEGDPVGQGYPVRLLGVNAPPDTANNPWGIVAVEQMKTWLTGKVVHLVLDNTIIEDDRTLPRYLYLENELINLRLIELGLARPEFQDPDRLFEDEFQAAAQQAQANQRGLWGADPTATTIRSPRITPTTSITLTLTPTPTATVQP